jgi:hypothetical protein
VVEEGLRITVVEEPTTTARTELTTIVVAELRTGKEHSAILAEREHAR